MKKNAARILLIVCIIFINIGCDQSTKFLAKNHLKNTGVIQIIDNYLIFHYTENNGGFLSMFSTMPKTFRFIVLAILPLMCIMLMIGYVLYNKNIPRLYAFGLCCIIGGGISNIFDRIMNKYVVDFMNIGIGPIRSGIFNFADLSIMLGFFILLRHAYEHSDKNQIFSAQK